MDVTIVNNKYKSECRFTRKKAICDYFHAIADTFNENFEKIIFVFRKDGRPDQAHITNVVGG